VVGSFEFAVGAVRRVGLLVESAVGERPTEPLVEEQEKEGDLDTFFGELVGIVTRPFVRACLVVTVPSCELLPNPERFPTISLPTARQFPAGSVVEFAAFRLY